MVVKKFISRHDSALGSRYDRLPTIDVRDYGARVGVNCTDAINNAFSDGVRYGLEVRLPELTLRTTGPLVWNNAFPRISGVPGKTIIQPDGQEFDWLTVGNDTGATNGPQGFVRGLQLQNTALPQAPSGSTAGLKLNSTRFVSVEDVWVRRAPVGFDAINNNFGSSFRNCRTLFGECRIGIRLRGQDGGTFGSGNDIPFYNCWFHGRDAGVWIDPNGGGYSFFGGQILVGSGASAFSDTRGNVVLNQNLDTSATGGQGAVSFFGTTFESTNYGWTVRALSSGVRLEFHSNFFKGNTEAAGILKIEAPGGRDFVLWNNCNIEGTWTNDPPFELNANANLDPCYVEINSHSSAGTTFGASGTLFVSGNGLLHRSTSIGRAHALQSEMWIHGGIRHRRTGNTIEVSFDNGTTWNTVNTTPVV